MHFPRVLSAPAPHGDHPENHCGDTYNQQDQFKCIEIIACQGQRVRKHLQVLGIKRRYPFQKQIPVAGSQKQPEYTEQYSCKKSPPDKIDNGKCGKYQESIEQKYFWRSHHIVPCLKQRMPGDHLNQQVQHTCQQEMQNQ